MESLRSFSIFSAMAKVELRILSTSFCSLAQHMGIGRLVSTPRLIDAKFVVCFACLKK